MPIYIISLCNYNSHLDAVVVKSKLTFFILNSFQPNPKPKTQNTTTTDTKRRLTMTAMTMPMAPTVTLPRPRKQRECYASVNLRNEWRSCYLKAMGLEEEDWVDSGIEKTTSTTSNSQSQSRPDMILTNLLPSHEDEHAAEDSKVTIDPWTLTARSMQTSIAEMALWIQTKKLVYISVYMSDDEASLIQSTVTSFIATTANEIEGLRQSLLSEATNTNTSTLAIDASTRHQHKTGIVQILLTLLQLEIAQPFRVFQKQRQRAAVQLWQNPYSCLLVTSTALQVHRKSIQTTTAKDQELDAALGLSNNANDMDSDDHAKVEQRFLPRRPSHRLQHDFLTSYYPKDDNNDNDGNDTTSKAPLQRPVSVLNRRKRPTSTDTPTAGFPTAQPSKDAKRSKTWSFSSKKPEKEQTKQQQQQQSKRLHSGASHNIMNYDDDQEHQQHRQEEQLQQEALLLTATVENDLDTVQKMEQMMVDITALLGQFATLVSDQQEDVWEIHDAVAQTKDNLDKGKENLVDAAERTKSSRHWTPMIVTGAGSLLLLFHWLRA
jgi:hypothetical protein